MTIVSYAQNFEDVILHRALRDVTAGTYVDVGAHDPDEFSVTKLFYERGWRGINIEPVAEYFCKLEAARPEDVNLNVAAGAATGTMQMFVVAGTGLSTLVAAYAASAEQRGFAAVPRTVRMETLDTICTHLPSADLHFLKIDVEGAEAAVLSGINLERTRPWIIIVEATRPGTPELAFEEWEPLLIEHRYRFVYFDGLNRFYLADERSELADAFAAPPNVFDEFVLSQQVIADQHLSAIDQWMTALPVMGAMPEQPDRIDQLKARFAGVVSLSESLLADLEGVTAERKALQMRSALLEAEKANLVGLLAERDARITALDRDVTAGDSRLAEALAERAVLADGAYRAAAEAGHFETEARRLKDALETTKAECSALVQDLARARDSIAEQTRARAELDSENRRIEHELRTSNMRISALEQHNEVLGARVEAIQASRSWRITSPMRAVMRLVTGRD